MKTFQIPERAIRLKHRETTTPQGCRVVTTYYTDLRGIVTECVVLSTKPNQEQRQ